MLTVKQLKLTGDTYTRKNVIRENIFVIDILEFVYSTLRLKIKEKLVGCEFKET